MGSTEATTKLAEYVEASVASVSRDGVVTRRQAAIQEENLVDFYVNGTLTVRFGCTASHVAELAAGHLRTEGMIADVREISSLSVDSGLSRVDAEVVVQEKHPLSPVSPVAWKPEAVFRIADEFALDKTAHARTRGAHSAFLCDLDGRILCMREDVGRHNAFDKAVGWALLNGVDLGCCMLYTSGCVPSDMASKAIRAGIPILVSKSVATDRGIELAREYGLTLICEARPFQFDIVSG